MIIWTVTDQKCARPVVGSVRWVYETVQKLLYVGISAVGILIMLSGLSIWEPVQLQYLPAVFGGDDIARYVHFICMSAIVAFMVVHVALALLVQEGLRAMVIGR